MTWRSISEKTLSDTGTVFVTRKATRRFAAAVRMYSGEEARKKLTQILLRARMSRESGPGDPEWWRARIRPGMEVEAMVIREGKLAVVTSVRVFRSPSRNSHHPGSSFRSGAPRNRYGYTNRPWVVEDTNSDDDLRTGSSDEIDDTFDDQVEDDVGDDFEDEFDDDFEGEDDRDDLR